MVDVYREKGPFAIDRIRLNIMRLDKILVPVSPTITWSGNRLGRVCKIGLVGTRPLANDHISVLTGCHENSFSFAQTGRDCFERVRSDVAVRTPSSRQRWAETETTHLHPSRP